MAIDQLGLLEGLGVITELARHLVDWSNAVERLGLALESSHTHVEVTTDALASVCEFVGNTVGFNGVYSLSTFEVGLNEVSWIALNTLGGVGGLGIAAALVHCVDWPTLVD